MKVYLEIGRRRTFASAVEWPGWCRSGKTETDALEALFEYGTRYKKAIGAAWRDLSLPAGVGRLKVVERLEGNATTEFGAPGVIPKGDRAAVSGNELDGLIGILQASWRAFEKAADKAEGATLRPAGPRGGGRALDSIRAHVNGAASGYSNALGGKVPGGESAEWEVVQRVFVEAIRARAAGELPDRGPRGGERWPARFAIRRSAWHALDHAWEIEDRAQARVSLAGEPRAARCRG